MTVLVAVSVVVVFVTIVVMWRMMKQHLVGVVVVVNVFLLWMWVVCKSLDV